MSENPSIENKSESIAEIAGTEASQPCKKRLHEEAEESLNNSAASEAPVDSSKDEEQHDSKRLKKDDANGSSKDEEEKDSKQQKEDNPIDSSSKDVGSTREAAADLINEADKYTAHDSKVDELPNKLPESEEENEGAEMDISTIISTENETSKPVESAQESTELSASKDGDKTEESISKPKETTNASSSYLSAGTTFKGGFGSFASQSLTQSSASNSTSSSFFTNSEKAESTESTPSIFSAGTTFKGGFSAFQPTSFFNSSAEKKDNPWANEDTKDQTEDSATSQNGSALGGTTTEDKPDMYVQVKSPVEQKKVETGEEFEESVFTCRAKLYALDVSNSKEGWKERGVGTVHVNTVKSEYEQQYKNKTKSRAVMRADGILKVILNIPLNQNTEIMSGMKSSLSSEKFVRISAFEDGKPFQYSLRTGSAEVAKKLYDVLKDQISIS